MKRSANSLLKNSDKSSDAMVASPSEESNLGPPEPERSVVSAYLAEIGRKGGLKGGKARAAKLSARARKKIAAKAARSRWSSSRKYTP
jgi:hypothetical protein